MNKSHILSPKTTSLLENYLMLPFNRFRIVCPYWANDLSKSIKGPFSGKGTPRQIVTTSYKRARKLGRDLDQLNKRELKEFLEDNRIGIDCSGFVFHLLNTLDKERNGDGIARKYLKNVKIPAWRASWKINADTLSSTKFTRAIKLKNVTSGDVIRLLAGKHVAFVVEVRANSITYAHCSNYSSVRGCHLGTIIIKDWEKDLQFQDWQELTGNKNNYKDLTYFPERGDSIRRLKWWQ